MIFNDLWKFEGKMREIWGVENKLEQRQRVYLTPSQMDLLRECFISGITTKEKLRDALDAPRDRFAGMALQGLLASLSTEYACNNLTEEMEYQGNPTRRPGYTLSRAAYHYYRKDGRNQECCGIQGTRRNNENNV